MICDMETRPLADGKFLHRCRRCGVERTSATSKYHRRCDVPDLPGTSPTVPLSLFQAMPNLASQAWNLVTSVAGFVADGMKTVNEDQYRQRLEICDVCDFRRNNRCLKCGCFLSLKACGRAFRCPAGKWPTVDSPAERSEAPQTHSHQQDPL